jgi:hypothetical protein
MIDKLLKNLNASRSSRPINAIEPLAIAWTCLISALALASVNDQAGLLELNGPEDIAAFTAGIDKATEALNQMINAYFQTPDIIQHVAVYLYEHEYVLSIPYLEKRADSGRWQRKPAGPA